MGRAGKVSSVTVTRAGLVCSVQPLPALPPAMPGEVSARSPTSAPVGRGIQGRTVEAVNQGKDASMVPAIDQENALARKDGREGFVINLSVLLDAKEFVENLVAVGAISAGRARIATSA